MRGVGATRGVIFVKLFLGHGVYEEITQETNL